jgi:membrane-associated phospholipid phosphatase
MTRTADDRATPFYNWTRGLSMAALQSLLYFRIGHVEMPRSTELFRTRLDDLIPFLPWTSWCYLPVYAAIFITCIVGFQSRKLFNRALLAVAMVMIVGAVCHLLIAAEYPRPVLQAPYGDLSTSFMAWVQRVDTPGNVFPSLHVAQTSTLAFILCRDRPRLGRITVVMGAVLALSTLTTKQHFIADVISGYALAIAASQLVLIGTRGYGAAAGSARTSGA